MNVKYNLFKKYMNNCLLKRKNEGASDAQLRLRLRLLKCYGNKKLGRLLIDIAFYVDYSPVVK